MSVSRVAVWGAAVVMTLSAHGAVAAPSSAERLDVYRAVVDAGQLGTLAAQGYDVSDQRRAGARVAVDIVATRSQTAKLAEDGIDTRLRRDRGSDAPDRAP